MGIMKTIFDMVILIGGIAAGFSYIVFATYLLPLVKEQLTGNYVGITMLFISFGVAMTAVLAGWLPIYFLYLNEIKMNGGQKNVNR